MFWPESISFNVSGFFGADYYQAQKQFLTAGKEAGGKLRSFSHPCKGPGDRDLTTDVALFGPEDAERLVIVVSGTHGPEGLAGSGCQIGWIKEGGPNALPPGVAVLLVHMINPWGCAWGRRQTENNVDLNRNFVDFAVPLPTNSNYDAIREALTCPEWRGTLRDNAQQQIRAFRRESGERAFASALFQGQYSDPVGIGFGGHTPSWSNQTLHKILAIYATSAKCVSVIDLHTGYGPFGWGTLLTTAEANSQALKLARTWFGDSLLALRALPEGLPYDLVGDLCAGVVRALPEAEVVPVVIEFGTYDVERLLRLQIEDCWLYHYGDSDSELGHNIRGELAGFFHPGSLDWCQMLHARAQQVIGQAIAGCAIQLMSDMSS